MNTLLLKRGTTVRFFRKSSDITGIVKYSAVMLAAAWMVIAGAGHLGYNWQWYRIPHYLFTLKNGHLIAGPLIRGLRVTFQVSGISLLLSFAFGLAAALLRVSESHAARILARCYLETIRNTPLVVQLFFIYFVLGPIFGIDRFLSAVLALSLFEGAYASEIFRSGIMAIPKEQWEAAHSLGLSVFDTYRCVILPQAVRRILPPLTSQAVSLVKDSALVSIIAVYDVTMQGQVIISETFLTFEIWFTIAAIYLSITVTLSVLANYLEHRFCIRF